MRASARAVISAGRLLDCDERGSHMRVVRLNEVEPQPWKNGGGITWEIAADENRPPEWRLSVALIDRSGRFSDYTGYDRTILSIGGGPVQLEIGGKRLELRRGEPLAFRGEAEAAGILCGSAARDLNVMTRRDRFTHDVKTIASPEEFAIRDGDFAFAFVIRGKASAGSECFTADECLSFDGADGSVRIAPETGASVCVVRIHRLESSSKR